MQWRGGSGSQEGVGGEEEKRAGILCLEKGREKERQLLEGIVGRGKDFLNTGSNWTINMHRKDSVRGKG